MKTTLEFRDLKVHHSWHRLLEERLQHWQRLTAVTATVVTVNRQRDGTPGFGVQVQMEVSGEPIHAGAVARSLKAALLTLSEDLEAQIRARKARRVNRPSSDADSAPPAAHGLMFGPAPAPEGDGIGDSSGSETSSLV